MWTPRKLQLELRKRQTWPEDSNCPAEFLVHIPPRMGLMSQQTTLPEFKKKIQKLLNILPNSPRSGLRIRNRPAATNISARIRHKPGSIPLYTLTEPAIYLGQPPFIRWITPLYIQTCTTYWRHAVAQFVEALRYKPEGRGFDSRWCNWNFSMT